MTSITLYGISNCDTVKKARAWLAGQGVAVVFHDYKKAGVPEDRLRAWIAALGWDRLVNRQGTTWRRLDAAAQSAVVDADSAVRALLDSPSLIRRPVVEWADGRITVGFSADTFAALAHPG